MPFKVVSNGDKTYKVTNAVTGKVYAYKTKDPKALIAKIEIEKHKK